MYLLKWRFMDKVWAHKFRRTTILIVGCLSVLAGVGLARVVRIDGLLVWALVPLALFTLRRRQFITLAAIAVLGLSLGLARGSIYMQKLASYQNLALQKVTIVGNATDDAVYGTNSQLSFPLGNLRVTAPVAEPLTGTIKASGFGEVAIYRGDQVQVSGQLYPTRGSNQASISYANLTVLTRSHSWVNDIRRRFEAGMQSALPEPLASFGLGLLIGQRSTLPASVSGQLNAVGLTHIIAVSGYNLTIMVELARRLLGKRSRFQTMAGSLLMIGGFLLLAGSSASITRAALVSVLSLAAWYYGRQIKPVVLIAFAAALTALMNPLYLWSDVGWYLSFLAFFGVLVLAPLIKNRLFGNRRVTELGMIMLESLCAVVMTIPIILYIFGQISLIALLSNALVLVLVPLGMLLTTVAGLAGMLLPALAGWFAWPARLLLTYMLDVVNILSKVPHAFVQNLSLPLAQMLAMYGLIAAGALALWHKTRGDRVKMVAETNGES